MIHTDELVVLKKIAEGTSSVLGKDFLKELVRHLGETIGVYGVWIAEWLEKELKLNALAFWLDGEFVSYYQYNTQGTPCGQVIASPEEIFHIPGGVVQLFPDDLNLQKLNAVSYIGVALRDVNGRILGHLAALDNKPMPGETSTMNIFRIFAARAAAELQRMEAEKQVAESEERLRRLIDGTNDAIIEINEKLEIIQLNRSAIELFGLPKQNEHSLKNLLTIEGLKKLIGALLHIKEKAGNSSYYRLQGYLDCVSPGGEIFPAEATITECVDHEKTCYILLLRNATPRKIGSPSKEIISEIGELQQKVFKVEDWREMERQNIVRALKQCNGKISGPEGAAAVLGLPATTLSSRLKALNISKSSFFLH